MRETIKFSKFGKILQEKIVGPNETEEIFRLEIPENYVGFLYYLANSYFPLKLNIDGEELSINEIIAPINSPRLFNPPFLIKKFVKISAHNTTKESKKISCYLDGAVYSVLTVSENVFLSQIKSSIVTNPNPTAVTTVIKTEEKRPTHPHIINHLLSSANTWYEIKLPKKISAWGIRCREGSDINYCFEPSGSTYMTLSGGETNLEDTSPGMDINAVYVKSPVANVTVELELWL